MFRTKLRGRKRRYILYSFRKFLWNLILIPLMKKTTYLYRTVCCMAVAGASFAMAAGPAYAAGKNPANPDTGTFQMNVPQAKRTVTGVVTDLLGPVTGANVVVKGTVNGTITDIDGRFTLNDVPDNAVIQVSFIGYLTQEITVKGNRTTWNIALQEDTRALDEVVVVGYGTQKKVNLSGAVAAVDMNKLAESRPVNTLSAALAGMAAGVKVNASNNAPGESEAASILVRGQGTLNNSAPLVIIDGVEASLNSVSPSDVESMSVLKDAASAAIYGSRAANGVLLITTKKGKKDSGVKFNYNGYIALERPTKLPASVSDYATYMELMNEAYENSGMGWPYQDQDGNGIADKAELWRQHPDDPLGYPNSDAFDVLFGNTAVSQQHAFSVSGGNESVTHYTSFTYMNNPGVVENTGYQRYSLRSNVDVKLKKWISVGTNLSGYYGSRNINAGSIDDVFNYGRQTSPGFVFRSPDGRYGAVQNDEDPAQNNVLLQLNKKEGENLYRNLSTRFYATVEPFAGLSVTGSYAYTYYDNEQWSKPVFIDQWNFQTGLKVKDGTGRSSVTNKTERHTRNFMDVVARYGKKFFDNRLDLNIMAGASQEQYDERSQDVTKYDLLDPALDVINGAIGDVSAAGSRNQWAMRSFFGRINLGWKDKYLVEFNLRSDGSSRFLPGKRWGYFPSGSVAWRIDQEGFMSDVTWLSALKVRGSYGSLGNNSVGDYDAVSVYGKSNYILGNGVNIGLSQNRIANPFLTWESTYVGNFGVDFGFLNNRLTGTVDAFRKRTANILIDLPAPAVHGYADIPKKNSAEVVNKGFELTLGWQDKIRDFSYYVNGNFSFIKNEVTKYKGGERTYDGNRILQEGLPINTLFLRPVEGIIQDERDLAKVQAMLDAEEQRAAAAGEKPRTVFKDGTPGLGDILYKDVNGDGVVDYDDRVTYGHGAAAPVTYGLSVGMSWKGVDFSFLIQGVGGAQTVYQGLEYRTNLTNGSMINQEIADGRWHKGLLDPNGQITRAAQFPRLVEQTNKINSDENSAFWLVSQNYLRVKNIQLGYTLPQPFTNRIFLDRLRIYCSLENYFTFTSYPGLDPESGWGYPAMKQASFGINVTF